MREKVRYTPRSRLDAHRAFVIALIKSLRGVSRTPSRIDRSLRQLGRMEYTAFRLLAQVRHDGHIFD